ncbi:MAG: hypothetical protein NC319_08250 [Butyricicoccus sp.]|nr:hypothetical protein [Butyricicoccus sp.]
MKSRASSSKPRIFFAVLLAAIVLAGSITAVLSAIAADQYWNQPHLQNALLDISGYGGHIGQSDSGLDETKSIVHECNEEAVPISEELGGFFNTCNAMIIDTFQDLYGVDVSEKLNTLQIMESAYPESVSEMVGGSHSSSFPNKLFLNKALLDVFRSDMAGGKTLDVASTEFSAKMLRTVYIHEAMHYLGFNSDSGFDHFIEAFAECLSEKVMNHSGIKYESITGYASIQGFAAQIAECDPEFIRNVLTMDDFDMGKYFNSKLQSRDGVNYAEYYDKMIGLVRSESTENPGRIAFYTQYLTYEYCKAASGSAKDILREHKNGAVMLFEIRWMLNLY